MDKVTIIGSGLAGCLLAIYLAKRGYRVDIYESRPDIRDLPIDYGRSINLAMSKRGITGLEEMGLMNDVWPFFVPMRARSIHEKDGSIFYQNFGRDDNEYLNAVKRSDLNTVLLNRIDKIDGIKVSFGHRLDSIDFDTKKLVFSDESNNNKVVDYQRLIGADGAGSCVRDCLVNKGYIQGSRNFLPHSYKEINIPVSFANTVKKEHLYLWARHRFMLLGNPNLDGSITGTLFMDDEGEISFSSINDANKVHDLFQREFPDVYPHLTNLEEEFLENPIGRLSSVNCDKWYYQDQCLLIGDAAHGIVPFFGQGMNSAFEDCRIFNKLLDENNEDWSAVFPLFSRLRKQDTDAVASMSMDNYQEIQKGICIKTFNFRKAFEFELMKRYPQLYISKHVLVMFSNAPYAYAKACGNLQKNFLNEMCANIQSMEEVNWQKVSDNLKQYDKKLTKLKQDYEIDLN